MKVIPIILFTVCCANSYCQTSLDGVYRGLKQISYSDLGTATQSAFSISRPGSTFYELDILKISGDSVFFDNCSISVFDNDTIFLPGDGIYQYFSGKFTRTDSFVHFNLNEVVVNYFEQSFRRDKDGHFEVIRRANNFEGKVTTQGINIDSVIFMKTGQLMVND